MRAVRRQDDVGGGDIPMHDAVPMEVRDRLGDLRRRPRRVGGLHAPACLDDLLECAARQVPVHGDEGVGELVGGDHLGQPRARAVRQARPHRAVRQLEGDLLAYEGAGAIEGHELREPSRAPGEDALDAVGVVDPHRMHGLLVAQAGRSPPAHRIGPPPRRVTDAWEIITRHHFPGHVGNYHLSLFSRLSIGMVTDGGREGAAPTADRSRTGSARPGATACRRTPRACGRGPGTR